MAWVDLASGDYEGTMKAKLVAVSNADDAQLVYTTDGTEPTASSKKAKSGEELEIPFGETTLKVGLLMNGAVSGILTRNYKVEKPTAFDPYDITVYANADQVGWKDGFNFWAWCDSPKENLTVKGVWPGDKMTQSKVIEGKKWYYQTYKIKSKNYMVSFVFSTGTGSPQTVDFTNINKDTYLEVLNEKNNDGLYKIKDVTADMPTTGITAAPTIDNTASKDNAWYTLSGMKMMQKPNQPGSYIHQGKKQIIK